MVATFNHGSTTAALSTVFFRFGPMDITRRTETKLQHR